MKRYVKFVRTASVGLSLTFLGGYSLFAADQMPAQAVSPAGHGTQLREGIAQLCSDSAAEVLRHSEMPYTWRKLASPESLFSWDRPSALSGVAGEHAVFSPDGTVLALADGRNLSFRYQSRESGGLEQTQAVVLPGDDRSAVESLVWHPNGKSMVIGLSNGKAHIVTCADTGVWSYGYELDEAAAYNRGHARGLAFSPNGAILVADLSDREEPRVYALNAAGRWSVVQELIDATTERNDESRSILFSPDSRTLVVGGRNLTFWERNAQEEWLVRHVVRKGDADSHRRMIETLAFTRNGILVSGAYDNAIKTWAPNATGAWDCLQTLTAEHDGHDAEVNCVASAPDGSVVSCSDDGTVKMWDTSNSQAWRCVRTLHAAADERGAGAPRGIRSVAYYRQRGPGTLVSGSTAGVNVWRDPWDGSSQMSADLVALLMLHQAQRCDACQAVLPLAQAQKNQLGPLLFDQWGSPNATLKRREELSPEVADDVLDIVYAMLGMTACLSEGAKGRLRGWHKSCPHIRQSLGIKESAGGAASGGHAHGAGAPTGQAL